MNSSTRVWRTVRTSRCLRLKNMLLRRDSFTQYERGCRKGYLTCGGLAMKSIACLVFVMLVCLLLPHGAPALETGTMRCQNGIVSINDTIPEVLGKCGPPAFQDRRQETSTSGSRYGRSYDVTTVDDWTYNFGPQEFMYQLIFHNGRVYRIISRDQGY